MGETEIFQRFALSTAIGALVGVERHWREREEPAGGRTAGVRTFALVGMLGGGAALAERAAAPSGGASGVILIGVFLGLAYAFTAFTMREAEAEHSFSVTSVVAAMMTYVLGAIAVLGEMRVAAAGAVTLTAILAGREMLHGFMRVITWTELRSAIVLLAMTLVILPLIPDRDIGPFGGLSPARVWTLAILLAAISFCGYVAMKLFGGTRGELVAGAIGGLLSSTAATLANARRSAAEGGQPAPLAAGALAAGAVSCIRTGFLVAAIAPQLLSGVAPALVAAAAAFIAMALALAATGRDKQSEEPRAAGNPFSLLAVLQMSLLLAAIGFLARAGASLFGAGGVLVVAGLSGLADVDAAVVTVAGMTPRSLDAPGAVAAILVAVGSNTLAKAAYAGAFGAGRFGLLFGGGTAAALAAGAAGFAAGRWLT